MEIIFQNKLATKTKPVSVANLFDSPLGNQLLALAHARLSAHVEAYIPRSGRL
jgi:hypothetical protein